MVQPKVPWPVFRKRLSKRVRPINGVLSGVIGLRPLQNNAWLKSPPSGNKSLTTKAKVSRRFSGSLISTIPPCRRRGFCYQSAWWRLCSFHPKRWKPERRLNWWPAGSRNSLWRDKSADWDPTAPKPSCWSSRAHRRRHLLQSVLFRFRLRWCAAHCVRCGGWFGWNGTVRLFPDRVGTGFGWRGGSRRSRPQAGAGRRQFWR